MIYKDLHIHTAYCDGNNTPEEMILSALEIGLDCIGFSSHSYTYFDESYAMTKENTRKYFEEINFLKNKYFSKIKVLCGIELDYYADKPEFDFDYIIGSVHYVKKRDKYIPVDETMDLLMKDVQEFYDGDFYSLCEDYYKNEGNLIDKTSCDIIGHFDLVSKFNEKGILFDTDNPRYISAWTNAADKLIPLGKLFEINTGGISRGFRTEPYPQNKIYNYLKNKGAKFLLASDSHSIDTIAYDFNKYENLI